MKKIIVCCGFALALLGTLAIEAAAQSSCSEVFASCVANRGGGVCSERMAICKRTGCWDRNQQHGGRICNLKKS